MSTPSKLEQLEARVMVVLVDQSNRIYSTDEIEEGIRQALGVFSLARGEELKVGGLDDAEDTTLEQLFESQLVLGAAGYVVNSRALEQASAFNQDEKLPADLAAWAEKTIQAFQVQVVDVTRQGSLHNAANPPWSTVGGWRLPDEP